MKANENMGFTEDVLQIRAYIIMGLSLLLPILMYIFIRSIFRDAMSLEHAPITPVFLMFLLNLLAVVYLHVIDYRNMKEVCENAEKLLVAVLVFQPIYFVFRQEMLGKPKQGAIIYAVVNVVEIVGVISMYVLACVRDVLEWI